MADAVFRVDGLRELTRALRALEQTEMPKHIKTATRAAAKVVADEAARRVPVRTGALRASIRPGGLQRGAVVRAGGARVPYAGWIEFGGTIRFKHKAGALHRPFVTEGRYIRPSARAKDRQVLAAFEREINQAIRRVS